MLASLLVAFVVAASGYQPVHLSSPAQLPAATQGSAYSYSFTATGGTGPPYNWNLKGGRLPQGLALSKSTGALTGTVGGAATTGAYGFTVCATGRKRPVAGSAPGNVACSSASITVVKAAAPATTTVAAAHPACVIAAQPPGVSVQIDGSRQTTVVSLTPAACVTGTPSFALAGTTPTGLSASFLAAPAGTQGTTLSLAAAQDAKEGNYRLTVVATVGGQRLQTVVVVTVNEPDFSGTYTGTWSGQFVSTRGDNCSFNEKGRATITLVKALPGSYAVTERLDGAVQTWNSASCTVTATNSRGTGPASHPSTRTQA